MKILHIDSCVRKDSRTRTLSEYLLEKLNGEVETVKLSQINLLPLNSDSLNFRDEFIQKNDFSHPMFNLAKQFINADIIIVSAPLWDLSFPALLKTYFENINISDLVFKYLEDGTIKTMCKAQKLYYITTSGGSYLPDDYGFNYVKALCNTFYGIENIKCIKAEGLDIYGADIENLLNKTKLEIDKLF